MWQLCDVIFNLCDSCWFLSLIVTIIFSIYHHLTLYSPLPSLPGHSSPPFGSPFYTRSDHPRSHSWPSFVYIDCLPTQPPSNKTRISVFNQGYSSMLKLLTVDNETVSWIFPREVYATSLQPPPSPPCHRRHHYHHHRHHHHHYCQRPPPPPRQHHRPLKPPSAQSHDYIILIFETVAINRSCKRNVTRRGKIFYNINPFFNILWKSVDNGCILQGSFSIFVYFLNIHGLKRRFEIVNEAILSETQTTVSNERLILHYTTHYMQGYT